MCVNSRKLNWRRSNWSSKKQNIAARGSSRATSLRQPLRYRRNCRDLGEHASYTAQVVHLTGFVLTFAACRNSFKFVIPRLDRGIHDCALTTMTLDPAVKPRGDRCGGFFQRRRRSGKVFRHCRCRQNWIPELILICHIAA